MKHQKFVAAVGQIECALGDVDANVAKIVRMSKEAADNGAKAIVFPELAVQGYSPATIAGGYYEISEPVPGPTTDLLCKAAQDNGIYIITGMSELSSIPGKLYNSQICCAPDGTIASLYRKIHVWGLEKLYWEPSTECDFATFETPWCKAGTMICYDTSFPETARCLALLGCNVIFDSAAWRFQEDDIWDLNTRSRALENHVYMLCSNLIGMYGDTKLNGHSRIIDPRGRILAELDSETEGIIYSEIDIDKATLDNALFLSYMKERRPEAYSLIADTTDR